MSGLQWFPCFPSKLLGAMAGMTPAEQLIYVIVLLRIYETGGVFVDPVDALARRSGFNKRVTTDALDRLFKAGRLRKEGDGIHNPIADQVVADSRAILQKRSKASSKAANARWKKPQQNQTNGNASRIPSQCVSMHIDIDNNNNKEVKTQNLPLTQNQDSVPFGYACEDENGTLQDLERKLFKRGREVLGKTSGGMIAHLLKLTNYDITEAQNLVDLAASKFNPRQFIGAVIRKRLATNGGANGQKRGSLADAWDNLQRTVDAATNSEGGQIADRFIP